MSGHMNAPLSSISAGARRRMRFWQQRYLFLMLLPTLVVVTMFAYKPIINWIIAFRDYQVGFSIFKGSWQGFKYFTEFFRDSADAGHVIKNTLVINIASLFINLSCAMVFAILLNELRSNKVRRIMQSFSIFPFFVSWVITYSFCRVFFNAGSGLVNALLINMGVIRKGINILGDPRHSYALIIGANLWKSLGYNSVIFLATIAGIDQEQYEAADIDGATRLQKIRFITIPSLAATLAVLLVLNSGWILNSNFEQFYQFSNPTNLDATEVFDMYVYRFGLKLARFSYATAVGIFKSIMSILLLFLSNFVYKKLADRSVF